MARESSQKIKLVKLLELLHLETDENHPMLASEVCAHLLDMKIPCDRRTLTKDIQALNGNFDYCGGGCMRDIVDIAERLIRLLMEQIDV